MAAQYMKPVIVNGFDKPPRVQQKYGSITSRTSPNRSISKPQENSSRKTAILNHINNSPLPGGTARTNGYRITGISNNNNKPLNGTVSPQKRVIHAQEYAKINQYRAEKRQMKSSKMPMHKVAQPATSPVVRKNTYPIRRKEDQDPRRSDSGLNSSRSEDIDVNVEQSDDSDDAYDSNVRAMSGTPKQMKKHVLKKSNIKVNHVKEIIRDEASRLGLKNSQDNTADKGVTINLYMSPDHKSQLPQTFNITPTQTHRQGETSKVNVFSGGFNVSATPDSMYNKHQMMLSPVSSHQEFQPAQKNSSERLHHDEHPPAKGVGQSSRSNLVSNSNYSYDEFLEMNPAENFKRSHTPEYLKELSAKHLLPNQGRQHPKSPEYPDVSSNVHLPDISRRPYLVSPETKERISSPPITFRRMNSASSGGTTQYLIRNLTGTKHAGVSTRKTNINSKKPDVVTPQNGLPPIPDVTATTTVQHTKRIREAEVQTEFEYEDSEPEEEGDGGVREIETQTERQTKAVMATQTETHSTPNGIGTQTDIAESNEPAKDTTDRNPQMKTADNSLSQSRTISTSTSELDKLDKVKDLSVGTSTADLEISVGPKVIFARNRTIATDTSDLEPKEDTRVKSVFTGVKGGSRSRSSRDYHDSRKQKEYYKHNRKAKKVFPDIKSMIQEEKEWEDKYSQRLNQNNNHGNDEDEDSLLSSDDQSEEESPRSFDPDELVYVMYLQTESGALIGPMQLEFDDVQLGLPIGEASNQGRARDDIFDIECKIYPLRKFSL